jgi:hypothetical protein
MAHFAKIEDGKVVNVIVLKNEDCGGGSLPDSEPIGQAFIASLGMGGEWKQTSYNKNFRGQYAGIGMSYSTELDCFHGPSPYPSWVLNTQGLWQAPTPKPDDSKKYVWDEPTVSWVEVLTPTL